MTQTRYDFFRIPTPLGYGFALFMTSVGLVMQYFLGTWIHTPAYFFLYPVAFLVAVLAGPGPAGLAIVLSGLGADFFYFDPHYRVKAFVDLDATVRLALFAGITSITAAFMRSYQVREKNLVKHLAEVRTSEEKFRLMANTAPILVWVADTQLLCTWLNDGWLEWTGRSLEKERGQGWAQGVHPEDIERCIAVFNECFDDRREFRVEYRLKHRSGQYRWIIDHGVPRYATDGSFEGYIGACVDIHDQKTTSELSRLTQENALKAVEESERQFRSLANSLPQLVWKANAQGVLTWCNDRWIHYTGTTPDSWGEAENPSAWLALVAPDERSRVAAAWQKSLATGETFDEEFPLMSTPSGKAEWFLTRAVAIRDAKGHVVKWFGSCTNIEDAKRHARALTEAINVRDEFLSIASHELKTPLTSLRLQAQLLQRTVASGPPEAFSPQKLATLASHTDRQVTRLVRLVDDMLDVSRISTGRLGIERERFDLVELVRDVIERMKPLFTAEHGTPPTLSSPETCWGFWDKVRIDQVIVNLLSNAARYGKGEPVSVRIQPNHDCVVISIADQGIGIAEEDQTRIFNRFERAVSQSEISGMGLGLFISREIVKSHQGRIWVESIKGKGSTFHLELPTQAPTLTPAPTGTTELHSREDAAPSMSARDDRGSCTPRD